MADEAARLPREIAARYFEMWNTGDSSLASEILSPDWIDHSHPEVGGPRGVQQAVEQIRAAQPDLRFEIESILGDGNLVAVVGSVGNTARADRKPSRLVWLIRLDDGRMAEMRTYRDTSK